MLLLFQVFNLIDLFSFDQGRKHSTEQNTNKTPTSLPLLFSEDIFLCRCHRPEVGCLRLLLLLMMFSCLWRHVCLEVSTVLAFRAVGQARDDGRLTASGTVPVRCAETVDSAAIGGAHAYQFGTAYSESIVRLPVDAWQPSKHELEPIAKPKSK